MNVPYLQTRYGKKPPPRVGVSHPTIAPYGAFTCSDDKKVLLSIQNEREWQKFCADLLGDAELASDARFVTNVKRCDNRTVLDSLIAEKFKLVTRENAVKKLTEIGIACGRLSDMDDLVAHPQARLITVEGEHGPIEMLAPGARIVGETPHYGAVPSIGEHTDAIRQEFSSSSKQSVAS